MRTILTLILTFGLGLSGTAIASDRPATAGDRGLSAAAMTARLDRLGYDVRRLTAKDGEFRTHLLDRDSGSGVKAVFDRQSGVLLTAQLAVDSQAQSRASDHADRTARGNGDRDDSMEHDSRRNAGRHDDEDGEREDRED